MNILQFIKTKFSFLKRLPAGKEDHTKLIDNMMNNKDAIMQFIEYKTFREENPNIKSKKIEIEGPYTNVQLEQLFTNPELQEAIKYVIDIFDNKQKSTNNIDKYNTILDKYECYEFVKRIDKEEYSKKAEETYNADIDNEKRDIVNYTEALKKYRDYSKTSNRNIRIQCIALIKDLKEMGVNDGIEEKELINEIGSIDMHEDLISGMEKVQITMAKSKYEISKMEEKVMNDMENDRNEEKKFDFLLEKQRNGEKLTDEEQIFVDRKWKEIESFIEDGTPEIHNTQNGDDELEM